MLHGVPSATRDDLMNAAGLDLSVTYPGVVETQDQDEWLISGLAKGDAAAVGDVYDAHHEAIRAFALRLVGDASAAEDLVHEVFLSLPRAVRGYERRCSLRTFLISIAVNHARHYVRSAARRRCAMDRLASVPEVLTPTDPERTLQRHQLVQLLSAGLDTLSLDQRIAFVLCEVEERGSREAASITGVPEATVRTRVFHAKRKLRAYLERRGVR
jgi:RNA polymerase sigma-70 factor (ECF subfamily)